METIRAPKSAWYEQEWPLCRRGATFSDDCCAIEHAPTIEERKTGRWKKLMMYLADLQLTYSPDWGANGCGDEKLYEFVTGLIEELEGWEDGGGA